MSKNIDDYTVEELVEMTTDEYLRALFSSGHPFLVATGAVLLGYAKYKVALQAVVEANPQAQVVLDLVEKVVDQMQDMDGKNYVSQAEKYDKAEETDVTADFGFDLKNWKGGTKQ